MSRMSLPTWEAAPVRYLQRGYTRNQIAHCDSVSPPRSKATLADCSRTAITFV